MRETVDKKTDRIIDEARRAINSTDRRTNLENLEQLFSGTRAK